MLKTSASNNKAVLETMAARVLANPAHTKKWQTGQENVKPKALVLLTEDVLPQNKWPLGRVVEVYPAIDPIVQVIKIKTSNGEYIQPCTKIYPLECSY